MTHYQRNGFLCTAKTSTKFWISYRPNETNKIGGAKGLFALVDNEDFARINKFNWCPSQESRGTKWYAIRWVTVNGKRVKIRMHYEVLKLKPGDLPPGHVIDHVNHDGLDNRKFIKGAIQLEIVTQEENMARSAGWKKKGRTYEPGVEYGVEDLL